MLNLMKVMAIAIISISLYSCSDDDNPVKENPTTELQKKYEYEANGNKYVLYTEKNDIHEGHNIIYVVATNAQGDDIANDLTLNVNMDMGEMIHSTPFSYEVTELDGKQYIKLDATFIMPSTEMGVWYLVVTNESMEINENLEFNVIANGSVKRFTHEDKSYFVTLRSLENPKVGLNDFEISVHTRENMMSHPAVEDLTIKIEPTMPSMGHGSEGNVNPNDMRNGIYKGKVNFNMTGDWEIAVTLMKDETEINTVVYTVNF